MTTTDTNVLRIFEMKLVRKIYLLVKGEEHWRIRTNKETKNILQGADIVTFIKFLQLRWYGHVERTQNQRMPTQTATATMKGEDHVKDGETRLKRT